MGYPVLVNATTVPLFFFMGDSSDPLSGKTGLSSFTRLKLKKFGVAAATPSGTVSEVDATNAPGWYQIAGHASDRDTLGPMILSVAASGAKDWNACYPVVAFNEQDAVRLGLSSMPNAAAGANGGLPVLSSSATTLAYTVSTLTNDPSGVTTLLSRLTSGRAGYLDNLSAGAVATAAILALVKASTDTLPSDPADASDIATATAAISALATAIKAKTDKLTFNASNQVYADLRALWGNETIDSSDRAPNLT